MVVPAECMLYFNPDFFSRRWTAAISWLTLAVGVPMGTRQKSYKEVIKRELLAVVGLCWNRWCSNGMVAYPRRKPRAWADEWDPCQPFSAECGVVGVKCPYVSLLEGLAGL